MPASVRDFLDLLASVLILGWLAPLAVIGGLLAILIFVRYLKQRRELEPDALICTTCRYDLRGGTGTDCPECGTNLEQGITPEFSRGAIIARGLSAPIHRKLRALLYVLAGVPPLVGILLALGLLMPFNYTSWIHILLKPDILLEDGTPPKVAWFQGERERGWLDDEPLAWLTFHPPDRSGEVSLLSADGLPLHQKAADVWDAIENNEEWLPPDADKAAFRDDFLRLFDYIGIGSQSGTELRAASTQFDVEWREFLKINMHPAYAVFVVLLTIGAFIVLIKLATGVSERKALAFEQKVEGLVERYRAIAESNRSSHHSTP